MKRPYQVRFKEDWRRGAAIADSHGWRAQSFATFPRALVRLGALYAASQASPVQVIYRPTGELLASYWHDGRVVIADGAR